MSGQSQKNQGHIGFLHCFEELFINTLSMQNDVEVNDQFCWPTEVLSWVRIVWL